MSEIPAELKYTKEHEWMKVLDDGTAVIGITDYAQESLGDVTFVELPEVGASFGSGEAFGVVESVKAASDLYMPVSCEVLEINEALEDTPESLNKDPYGEAWLVKVKITDDSAMTDLMDAEAYGNLV